jgi:accessory gene regulator B
VSITQIAVGFCNWLNKINPKSAEENEVIRYGMELFLDNAIKLIAVLIIGIVIGKGLATLIILSAFCFLRAQAGGIHARTGWGCGLGVLLVWAISILSDNFFRIEASLLPYVYVASALAIISCVPRTINIEHFTSQDKLKKKLSSIFALTLMMAIAFFNPVLRGLIIYPVILEVLTLLPKIK